MFGIGESELVIIVVFGFLLFGPDKLPGMGRTIGRFLRQFREAQEGFQQVVQAEVVDPLNDAMNSPANKAAQAEIDADADLEGTDSELAARKSETFAERKARLQAERKAREEAEKAAEQAAAEQAEAEQAEAEEGADAGEDSVAEDGSLNSAVGNWIPNAEIVLKASRDLRFGQLQIDKHVTDFAGEPATFVFHVVDTATGGEIYDNYASIYYDGGESHSTTLTQIPAGLELTVTEVYEGARFEADGPTTATATIVSGETVTVSFNNKRNGSGKGGHGIENHFEFGEDGDWHWTAIPSNSAEAA